MVLVPNPALTPQDTIEGALIRGHKGAFVVGCYDQRITFYSQQVRALALVHALAAQEYLKGGPRIAVIGGGAAGMTAAAAAALASEGQVVLFEAAQDLLKLQSATDRRRLDPHIYNWPRANALDPVAGIPILDWCAGPSNEVRADVVQQFEDIAGRVGNRLTKQMRSKVKAVAAVADSYELTIANVDTGVERTEQFQLLFFAFGFGLEPTQSIPGIHDRSYWDNAGMPGAEFQGRASPQYFISGNGDGGLIDLVAAASANFDHADMIRRITTYPGLAQIEIELLNIEREARQAHGAGTDFDLFDAYEARLGHMVEANGLVAEVRRGLRPGVQVILQTRDAALLSLDSSILNRFAVFVTVRACAASDGCGFSHKACAAVSQVAGYVPAAGEASFQLDCDGELLAVDEVIIRRGTDKALVRQPFDAMLSGYEVQHRAWLERLGDVTLIPTLSIEGQDYFRDLATRAHLPGSQRRIQLAQAAMPVSIHVGTSGGQVRWAGDRTPQQIAEAWEDGGVFQLTIAEGPEQLGAVGGALLRVAAHAPHLKVFADVAVWSGSWQGPTTRSLHGTGIPMPSVVGGNPGGGAQERELTNAIRLAGMVHRALDTWMLARMDEHLRNFAVSGVDPRGAIDLTIAQDLRAMMLNTWKRWHEALQDNASLLGRFLRLMISATDEDGDAVQVLVGPRKLDRIICGTALALAVASVWSATDPYALRPGNLLRRQQALELTGHGCAADRVLGKRMLHSAQAHDWQTSFVLLAVEGTLDLARKAEVILTSAGDGRTSAGDDRQPSLSETTGSGPLMMWITEQLVDALSEGAAALSVFLADAERRRERPLLDAIERQKEPS